MYLLFDKANSYCFDITLKTELLPCIAKVSKDFILDFSAIEEGVQGVVNDWSMVELNHRSAAGGGGRYVYHRPALVTVDADESGYKIVELSFFSSVSGWNPIMKDGNYVEPYQFCDVDE